MIYVTRKDDREANANIIRRFMRKVQQSGLITKKKAEQYFAKAESKVERRKKAIIRKARKELKAKRMRLGQAR